MSSGKNCKKKQVSDDVAGAAILKKQKSDSRSDYETIYCYTEEERLRAIERLGPDPEITRFKGLGEISPDEFKHFIGPGIRLEQVTLHKSDKSAICSNIIWVKIRWSAKSLLSTTSLSKKTCPMRPTKL